MQFGTVESSPPFSRGNGADNGFASDAASNGAGSVGSVLEQQADDQQRRPSSFNIVVRDEDTVDARQFVGASDEQGAQEAHRRQISLVNGSDTDSDSDDEAMFMTIHTTKPPLNVTAWQSFAATTRLSASYTASDIAKRPRNFCIGLASIIIIVFFVGIILVGTSKTPVIFLRFAELNVGEMDAVVLAEGSLPFVNYTTMKPRIDASPETSASVPRWLLKGEAQSYMKYRAAQNTLGRLGVPLNSSRAKQYIESTAPSIPTSIVIIDSLREKAAGVGRAWDYRPIGYAEVQGYRSALRFIQVTPNVGDRLRLFVDIAGILAQQGVNASALSLLPGLDAATNPLQVNLSAVQIPVNLSAIDPAVFGNNTALRDLVLGLGNVTIDGNQLAGVAVGNTSLGSLVNASNAVSLNNLLGLNAAALRPELMLTVADAFPGPDGKYPASLGNTVILDYRFLVDMLLQQACYSSLFTGPLGSLTGGSTGNAVGGGLLGGGGIANAITNPLGALGANALPTPEEIERQFNLEHFTLAVVAMMKRRFTAYYKETQERKRDMIRFSNDMFLAIGIDFEGDVQYPISVALDAFSFFSLFLDSIFFAVVAVVIVLGTLLVFSLLLTNTEERSFEVAMIRSQGLGSWKLLHLLVFQSAAFVIPGIAVAMALLLATNAVLEVLLSRFTKAPEETTRFTTASLVVPVVMGVAMPVFANFGPIRSTLTASLRDALDVYRQKNAETKATMVKLAELGLELWQTLLGIFLVVAGFAIYYMIPYAFIFNQLWLFFLILNLIIMTMLFGLSLVSYTLQGRLERIILWGLLWGPDRRLRTLIVRNLGSHRERNEKSFLMFVMSSSVLIFGSVLFTLLAGSVGQQVAVIAGADVTVQSLARGTPLNRTAFDGVLSAQQAAGIVASWSYATFALRTAPQLPGVEVISNINGFPASGQRVVGVDENLLDTVFPQYIQFEQIADGYTYGTSSTGVTDVVRSMFTQTAKGIAPPASAVFSGMPPNASIPSFRAKYGVVIPCILAIPAKKLLGLSAGMLGLLEYDYYVGSGPQRQEAVTQFLIEPRALVNRMSGFPLMNGLQFTFGASSMLVPISVMDALLNPNKLDFPNSAKMRLAPDAYTTPRLERLFVRLAKGVSETQREDFANLLQSRANPYYHVAIDTVALQEQVAVAGNLILYFFYFVAVITVILDTFMLWLAFVSNVKLNSWGFAVLRSLGFTVPQLTRAYVYEALAIVISAFVCGTVIGVVVAYTLMIQMNLFLQLPLVFDFPVPIYFFLLGISIISAIIGSWIPSRQIGLKSISSVLKKGD